MKENNTIIINNFYDKKISYNDQDFLDFSKAKDAFMKIIIGVKPPVTVGLYGSWGSGKSWMIEGLKQDLEKKNNLVVTFDAWKYRHENNLILPLMCAIEKEVAEEKEIETKKNDGNKYFNKFLKWWDKRKEEDIPLLGSLGLIVANQFIASKCGIDLYEAEEKAKEKILTAHQKYVDNIQNIEEEYKEFINQCLLIKNEKIEQKEKLVIFIDNLDRCLPDIVVNLLEDISTFLLVQDVPCLYVLAMDKDNVIKAINHRYPDFDGKHYLEKIVQIALNMPIPQKRQNVNSSYALYFFMKRYEKAKGLDPKKDKSTKGDSRDAVYKSLENTAKEVFDSGYLINPRRIERIVNKFVILKMMTSFDMENQPQKVPFVLFLILLGEFHSTVYKSLKDEVHYKNLQEIIQISQEESTSPEHFRQNRKNDYKNFNFKNYIIVDEYCDNQDFYELLKGFKSLGNFPDFANNIQRINDLLPLVGN